MQNRIDVGRPLAVFVSLIGHLNRANIDSGWLLGISPMTEPNNFWEVVRKYRGRITAASFSFVTPNVLGLRSQLNAGLKDARQNNNAHRVDIGLINKKGTLELERENIQDAVEYVSEGGGMAKIKSGRKTVYNSENDERTFEVESDEPISAAGRSTWREIVSRIFD